MNTHVFARRLANILDDVLIASKEMKILWGRAGGMCSNCQIEVTADGSNGIAYVIGEQAHIVAKKKTGPRGATDLPEDDVHKAKNLILLCPNCHSTVDSDPGGWPPELLREIKADHEKNVREAGNRRSITEFSGRVELRARNVKLAEAVVVEEPTEFKGAEISLDATNTDVARGLVIRATSAPKFGPKRPARPKPTMSSGPPRVIGAFRCPNCRFSAGLFVGSACPQCGEPIP